MPSDSLFSRFDAITLDEMNATARMMTRVDRKYLLSTAEAFTLVDALPSRTRILTVNDQIWQHYRTSYLDSSRWGSYHATAYKRRRRYKVRMRNYVDSGLAFLEVKTRGPRKTTVKNRTPITVEAVDGDAVPAESVEWLAGMLEQLCVSVDVADLRPTLRNEYWRATVKLPDLGRATIDTSLAWRSSRGGELSGLDLVCVETKSGASPSVVDKKLWASPSVVDKKLWASPSVVDKKLWARGHRPLRVSKFGTGLAVMHPELPSNKWRPAMKKFELARQES